MSQPEHATEHATGLPKNPKNLNKSSNPSNPSGPLSERECDVLALIAEGLPSAQVAARLGVSRRTVEYHLQSVYAKLGVNNRMLAVREARRWGLLPPSAD